MIYGARLHDLSAGQAWLNRSSWRCRGWETPVMFKRYNIVNTKDVA